MAGSPPLRLSGEFGMVAFLLVERPPWPWRRSGLDRPDTGAGSARGGSDKRVGIFMDSLITAAARALASGDALGALNYVALRDDPPALALRGVAMAQLGDLDRAKTLLKRAGRG